MPIYFLSAGHGPETTPIIERRIREVIPDLARIANLEDFARHRSAQSNEPIQVLVTAPPGDNGYFDRLVDIASRHRDRAFFILISDDISATDYKRLVRTGGADWVSTAGAPQEILDIIAKRRSAGEATPSAAGTEPVVVAFVPSAGGVGNATLVTEIGLRVKSSKASRHRRVCIVDLDFQTSHVCDHLDIQAQLQIQEISSNPARFDTQLFDLFTSRHSSGLDVFAAPRSRFNVSDLNVAALDTLFDMIATRYDLVLIDLPEHWFPWMSDIIANSDGVVVSGINTIPCLRQTAETLAAIRSGRRDTSQIAVVINRCEHKLLGGIARRQHVEAVLVNEKIFYVRNDTAAAAEAANTGVPMTTSNPSGPVAKEIGLVAAYCAELKSIRPAIAHRSATLAPS